jgi:UDP-sulfoquinovose synthase
MRVLILGGDGYLGWPTAMHFAKMGHKVAIVDNLVKRFWEAELGVSPLFEIASLQRRVEVWNHSHKNKIDLFIGDIAKNHRFTYKVLDKFQPDTVVHYAEQPSAPFSMLDREKCVDTSVNNIVGTINLIFAIQKYNPNIHIIKLGTMGEYGTPNIDIEEGWIDIEHKGRKDRMLYPKKPGSFYHVSKVADSQYLEFVCRVWGLRVTDLNQGVVYGVETPETLLDSSLETSFHYDQTFGTVINRFITQAVMGIPLTVYGHGGQTRGYLNIVDTLKCVELAVENPAASGEFRVFNQFTEQFSVLQLAELVKGAANTMGISVEIESIKNPRVEQEAHYYNALHSALPSLGLKPTLLSEEVLIKMLSKAHESKLRVNTDVIYPNIMWRQN